MPNEKKSKAELKEFLKTLENDVANVGLSNVKLPSYPGFLPPPPPPKVDDKKKE